MKKLLLLFILFLQGLFSLGADDVLILEKKFSPEKFHVGDSVSLILEVLNKDGEEFLLPEEIETRDNFVLDDISLTQKEETVLISMKFRSFEPGSGYTPPLRLGDKKLPSIPFYTTPVLSPGDKDLFSVRDQALFPGAKLYTSLIILILIISPVLALFFIKYTIKYSVILIRNYMRKRPFKKFNKLVKKLDVSLLKMEQKVFYAELTEGLKEYLSFRADRDLTSLTTGEIACVNLNTLSKEDKCALVDWLRKSDLIKFAGSESSMEERKDSLEILSSLCSKVETGSRKKEEVDSVEL